MQLDNSLIMQLDNSLIRLLSSCIIRLLSSEVESHPSTAINACYQQAFQTKTEYSGLAVMGFENEFIIKQLIDDIAFFLIFCRVNKLEVVVSSIGSLDENRLYNVGTGFVSSFTTRYRGAQHLFVLKIEESLCVLEIYSEPVCVNKITGSDPDEVWNQVEFLKKYIGSYLFGITNTLVQEHLNANNKSPTCAVKEWTDIQKLEKVFNRHIKSRKIPSPMASWPTLFYIWSQQKSSVIQFPLILQSIYEPNYIFQEKELRAWHAMFTACGCTNVTPVSEELSSIEFWSKALDSTADKELLENPYKNNIL
ncbi:hypothetical protein C2G38_2233836 [Gigaspora rosea]|uniref:Uncharacterized protein n=1 Tax=Gigaspora rosea TaxID=44941 RepID=A0A397TRZ5_9GLOM|nr:hypothetical protein C2G38_2233836 [Gigaspora rosea]